MLHTKEGLVAPNLWGLVECDDTAKNHDRCPPTQIGIYSLSTQYFPSKVIQIAYSFIGMIVTLRGYRSCISNDNWIPFCCFLLH